MKDKRLKLGMVRNSTSYLSIGNYNPQELGLGEALVDLGVQVDVFYANNKKRNEQVCYKNKVRIFYMRFIQIIGQHGIFLNVFKFLRLNKYSLVQVSEESSFQSVLIGIWCKLNGIPVILWQGMYSEHKKHIKHIIIQKCYNFLCLPVLRKCVSLVICKTEFAENYIKLKGFTDTKILKVGFNGYKLHSKINERLSENLISIDSTKKIILFVGRLVDDKNPFFILELAHHYKSNKNIQFVMVGDGKYKNAIKDKIRELGVDVIFIPKLDQKDLGQLYNMTSIFLMPSTIEIYGIVYMECMSFGIPIVSLENAGAKSIIDDKKQGFIIPKLDQSLWTEKIDFLLTDDVLYKNMSDCSKSKVKEYDWHKLALEYLQTYQSAIKA